MDKFYRLLDYYDNQLDEILYSQDISDVDVLYALDELGFIDVETLLCRVRYSLDGKEDDEEAFD